MTAEARTFGPELDSGLSLADYLDAVRAFVCRYVAFSSEHEPVAVALWVAHAWLVESFEVSPLLAVTSAEMRSGKTRLLDALELLVPFPERMIVPSEAVVYTLLAQRPRPTLLLDEADAIFGPKTADRYEGLRAILNSGNRIGTTVPRVKLDGKRREVERFDVYGPKVVAGIGELPATVADRAIPIRMKRRAPGEVIERFRLRRARDEAARIVLAVTDVTDVTGPAWGPVRVPDELSDRAADSWEVLLAIADTAAGPWPLAGRLAAVALSSDEPSTTSDGMRLLSDIRDAFGASEFVSTADLLAALHRVEDGKWSEWYGWPLTPKGLASLLAPYRIAPAQRRTREGEPNEPDRVRGYARSDLEDVWSRYLAPMENPRHPRHPRRDTAAGRFAGIFEADA